MSWFHLHTVTGHGTEDVDDIIYKYSRASVKEDTNIKTITTSSLRYFLQIYSKHSPNKMRKYILV